MIELEDIKSIECHWNYVLIDRDEPKKQTAGGLFIPELSEEEPWTGTVVSAGPGWYTPKGAYLESALKAGDRVIMNRFAGYQIKLGDKIYYMMQESHDFRTDVWAKLEEVGIEEGFDDLFEKKESDD